MTSRYGIYIFFVSISVLLNTPVKGQLSRPGKPLPIGLHGTPDVPVYSIHAEMQSEKNALLNGDSLFLKPARSGSLIPVDFTPANSGAWDTLSDGMRIWRIGFTVNNASLLNVIFSPYRISSGIRIFLYDPYQLNVIGALSDLNNKSFSQLATSYVPGNTIIIEMQVPAYLEDFGDLGISGIGCDYYSDDIFLKRDEWFGTSGVCNEDIVCRNDSIIEKIKNSVVRIVFLGHERCTGTLVNTSQNQGVHYILTAGHCFKEEKEANTAVFYFQYESPFCDGPDGNTSRALSGATIRARSDDIDFALLELLEPVPFTYHPYYAGWDYRQIAPQSGLVIHHPLGDVKKIAFEQHPLTVSSFGNLYKDNTHWLVSHWESGTTEAGSSGAPYFDAAGRIKGTLTGGLAKCENPVKDYFQMFSHSWKDIASPQQQLAVWLDPGRKTSGFLDGFDPYSAFWETGDTLSNIADEEILTVESDGLIWGSYSGHNNLGTSGFAEKFETTAEMISGINLFVKDNFISRNNRYLNIVIWSGSSTPESIIYSQSVPLDNLIPEAMNFVEFDSAVQPGSIFFAGFELFYPATQDTFSVYMAANRSLNGSATAFVSDGTQWTDLLDYSDGSVRSSFAIYPVVYGELPDQNENTPDDFVTVYPNPSSAFFYIRFREMKEEAVNITLFNMQGQVVINDNYGPYQHIIPVNVKGIASGIYILRAKQGGKSYNLKVAVVK
ncbi:MAG TPA: T9SS type A sorting domain-containing protein [Bacteroidales bacterium]|jgi:hypothetical protein|nr:T9SS type A sorting domain-containing protein [Bacteroidales bacterium]